MTWFNRAAALRLAGGLCVLALAVIFLFDPALRFALRKGGAAAAGAKVDVASVRSHWFHGRLDVYGLAVADKNAPMKNVVEASRLGFVLDVSAALRGKAVIREASIEGIRFGTARTTSGALPHPPPPSKLELALKEKLTSAAGSAIGSAPDVKANASAQIDATKLQGLKKLDEAKAKAAEIEARWKGKQAETAALAAEAQKISDDAKSLGGGGNPIEKAKKAAELQKRIKDLIGRVDAQRDQAKKDLAEVQDLYKQAAELRGKDVNGLLSAAGLPTLDSSDLAKRLLGPQTAARLGTALHWMKWAREKAAARKKTAAASPATPARRAGVDVEFPRAHSYPQFLLENARLSGGYDFSNSHLGLISVDKAHAESLAIRQALSFKGNLNGVTSNPDLYVKPATLTLEGSSEEGQTLKISGELDQQNDPVGIGVKFEGAGFPLAGASLGDGEVGGTLSAGTAKVTGEIRSSGDEWKGEIAIQTYGVKIEPKTTMPGPAGAAVSSALGSLNAFQVRIGISGKESDLKLTFASNIGDALSGAMKKAFSGQLEGRRKEIEAKVAALYGPKSQDAHGATDGLASKILGPLDAQRSGLDRQLQDTLKKSFGGAPDLRKLFK